MEHASVDVRIAKLEMTVRHLRKRGRLTVAQRDDWERRALAAEKQVAKAEQQLAGRETGNANWKYGQLTNALAKEFRPIHSPATGMEKIIRADIFKLIWPKIEETDRS